MTFVVGLVIRGDGGDSDAALRKTGLEVERLGNKTAEAGRKTAAAGAAQRKAAGDANLLATANHRAVGSVGNLAAQFNDIGVMLASGQSPLQLALQQGTQIGQVLGPLGAGGAVKALGAGFLAMLSPVNLITIGSIAAGAAMIQWLTGAGEKAVSTEDAMDAFSNAIKAYQGFADLAATSTADLTEKFGSFAGQVKGFAEYMRGVSLGTILTTMDEAVGPLKGNLADVVAAMGRLEAAQEAVNRAQRDVDQNGASPEILLQAAEAMELYRANAEAAAKEVGLLPDQAMALAAAMDELGAASGVAQIRDEAAEALAMIRQWYPAGAALPPELRSAATYLNQIVNQAAEATRESFALGDAVAALPGALASATAYAGGLASQLGAAAENAWETLSRLLKKSGRENCFSFGPV